MSASPAVGSGSGFACPRCATAIRPEQDWCLACGHAARTRLAPTPPWKVPLAIVAIAAVVALLAATAAFVTLTRQGTPARTPTAPAGTTAPADGATATP